ncbi:MAG: hypothetical protein ABI330_09900 [Caldimonas sp.]
MTADSILASLEAVAAEREHRLRVAGLDAGVVALKAFQQRRFSHTYADLLATPRYGPAARFFLGELYGPREFVRRDAQLARVVPGLAKLFPKESVDVVAAATALHALSEALDTAMAMHLGATEIAPVGYARTWQGVGRATERREQIALTARVAQGLDDLTRRPLLRNGLRLMRGPARAAGLGELQRFMEAGFDTFRAMHGAGEFIAIVQSREQGLAESLFAADMTDAGPGSATERELASLLAA